MTPNFEEKYNKLIALFPPKTKMQAEIHREAIWEILKFDKHLITEVFNRVMKEWEHVSLPPPKYFQGKLNEVRYGERDKKTWHKDIPGEQNKFNPECECEGCQLYKRAVEGKCLNLKCNRDRGDKDEFCNRCHVIAKHYYCLCDMCEAHRKRLLDTEKIEEVNF